MGHPKTFHPRFFLDSSRVHSGSELGFQILSGFSLGQTGQGAPLIDVLDFLFFISKDKNAHNKGRFLEICPKARELAVVVQLDNASRKQLRKNRQKPNSKLFFFLILIYFKS